MWDGEGMIPPNIKKEIQLVAPLSKIAFYQLVFVTAYKRFFSSGFCYIYIYH